MWWMLKLVYTGHTKDRASLSSNDSSTQVGFVEYLPSIYVKSSQLRYLGIEYLALAI